MLIRWSSRPRPWLPLVAFPALIATQAAASPNPLICDRAGNTKYRCRVTETQLLTRQDFQVTFEVPYRFDCHGHDTGLAIVARDGGSTGIVYGTSGRVRLEGHGPFLVTDVDPGRTYRATLIGPCALEFGPAIVKPSFATLELWKREAAALARELESLLHELRLARDLEQVVQWDDGQLKLTRTRIIDLLQQKLPPELPYESLVYPFDDKEPERRGQFKDAADMPPGWEMAVVLNPDIPYLVTLRAHIESILNGRPPVYSPNEVPRIKSDVADAAARAELIIERAERWQREIDDELKNQADRLKQLKQEGSAI
ncbi:hypothetical protein [Sorangium sp. So ce1389]|uniref:hypothetical protein n=1 Tax=Sorangium sp. So ce1389 TaxID=3133336 RepID=UPI003F60C1D3